MYVSNGARDNKPLLFNDEYYINDVDEITVKAKHFGVFQALLKIIKITTRTVICSNSTVYQLERCLEFYL
jgi:hypothetical protein